MATLRMRSGLPINPVRNSLLYRVFNASRSSTSTFLCLIGAMMGTCSGK